MPGTQWAVLHCRVGRRSSTQGPEGGLALRKAREGVPGTIRGPGKEGHLEREGRRVVEGEGMGGTSPWKNEPEKRRCSMKSRWKGESVNRRS